MRSIFRLLRIFLLVSCGISLYACTSSVYYRKAKFSDLLEDCRLENKYLFLYLYNDGCNACEHANQGLSSAALSSLLNEKFISTKKNITDEFWLSQVFYAASTPTFIVLNANLKILYIQSGYTTETVLQQVLTDLVEHKMPVYPSYTSSLYTSGERMYDLFEPVLNAWILQNSLEKAADYSEQVKIFLEESIAIEPYFMNQYLLYKWYAERGDSIRQRELANKLVHHVSQTDHILYGDLINEILKIDTIDSGLPVMQVNDKNIRVEGLQVGEQKKVVVPFKNVGATPLYIRSVDISCGCLKGYWDRHPVLPQSIDSISFIISPTSSGRFMKRAAVASNAKELTILTFIGDVK